MLEYYPEVRCRRLAGQVNDCNILAPGSLFNLIPYVLVPCPVGWETQQGIDQAAVFCVHLLADGSECIPFQPGSHLAYLGFRRLEPDAAEIIQVIRFQIPAAHHGLCDPGSRHEGSVEQAVYLQACLRPCRSKGKQVMSKNLFIESFVKKIIEEFFHVRPVGKQVRKDVVDVVHYNFLVCDLATVHERDTDIVFVI